MNGKKKKRFDAIGEIELIDTISNQYELSKKKKKKKRLIEPYNRSTGKKKKKKKRSIER